jgi:hypothetical protein
MEHPHRGGGLRRVFRPSDSTPGDARVTAPLEVEEPAICGLVSGCLQQRCRHEPTLRLASIAQDRASDRWLPVIPTGRTIRPVNRLRSTCRTDQYSNQFRTPSSCKPQADFFADFFCFAHLARCAAAIRARPSALMVCFLAGLPGLRPVRTAPSWPVRRLRTARRLAISESIEETMSAVFIQLVYVVYH